MSQWVNHFSGWREFVVDTHALYIYIRPTLAVTSTVHWHTAPVQTATANGACTLRYSEPRTSEIPALAERVMHDVMAATLKVTR